MKTLVLAGGGHAHLYSLSRAASFTRLGVRVVLVSPEEYQYYSGMGPGLLSGLYLPAETRFDLPEIARKSGAEFVRGAVAEVKTREKLLILRDGIEIPYDFVSFSVGSAVGTGKIPGAAEHSCPVKPIINLYEARKKILELFPHKKLSFVVVGGGPAGVEIAGNLQRLSAEYKNRAEITLIECGARPLGAFPPKAGELAQKSLASRGIRTLTGKTVKEIGESEVILDSGEIIPSGFTFLASGIVVPDIFSASGLAATGSKELEVDEFLRHPAHPEIFGGGDCVKNPARPLPKVGVYAVRQGPVLYKNLLAALTGKPLTPFEPQKKFLQILNLGDGTGLLARGNFVTMGEWELWLKKRLDAAFMKKYGI